MRLRDDLQARGHSVWIDVEKLTPGCDWEAGIADALTWVKDAQENGRVLLLMTPHALRRPDGYCLNEIARASSLKLNIFPVLVCESEPPQSISMLPYFDLQSCLPLPNQEIDSNKWDEMIVSAMTTPIFVNKVLRLTGLLEACDTMTSPIVTSIGGMDNLSLFQSAYTDEGTSKSTKTPTYIKLLSPKGGSFRSPKAIDVAKIKPATISSTANNDAVTKYVFVFDSTSAPLAKKLHADLTAQGMIDRLVTIKHANIKLGFSIHPHLAPSPLEPHARRDAITWAASGKMILLLTPQSVGRPHGVCLNDISAAMSSNVGFVPLMVRPCEIPLSICRIQWLDLSDCLVETPEAGFALNEIKYSVRLPLLVTALQGNLDHDGQQARLFSIFSPFSFQAEISKFTSGFVGREWVTDQLNDWKASTNQTFWITGQIGSGKTALAASIIQNQPEVRAFHLVCKDDEQTQSHRRCILSLAYQLTTQLPEYAEFLHQGEPLEEIVPVSCVIDLLHSLIVKPLNAIAQPNTVPLVILIDGLDSFEEAKDLENCIVSSLTTLLHKLPSWVRLILTSRENPTVMRKLQGLTPQVALDKCIQQSNNDIVKYLKRNLLPFVENKEAGVPVDTINFIVGRAEGLFLYASHIVNALSQRRLTLDKLESFPTGMGGFLRQFFEDQFTPDHYKENIRPLLEVLCAAYEPLNLNTLQDIMKWDAYAHHEFLDSFKSLLYISDSNELKPFHTSVFEWLQDSNSAGPFFSRIENGHERIGMWAWKTYDSVLRATTDVSNMNFELGLSSASTELNNELQTTIYIIRHGLNHLQQANTVASIEVMQKFASDEKFQLARRLLRLRQTGLESFFHGDIDRVVAQDLLTGVGTSGAFLIRYSAKQKSYCASFIDKVVEGEPQIKHNIIYHLDSGAYSAVQPKDVQKTTPIYADLLSFVEAYQRKGILKTAVPRPSSALA
ncbi:Aste57867_944 [Aphanomyces stellatus]|uniref:Aste57867_944 protein n=1 Tax=Aphanomyces stellatus TaxID=120398 RepID=A0A485K767_9STRA|nr:hypothetical protein As57867_000943 [Aphanomyces stellatus]VFT78167.1 Aste57867_944 [Aphanomyces stellatus]